MEASLVVATLWLVFAATHLGLSSSPLRGVLVARLGQWGFTWLFVAIAVPAFSALVLGYAQVQGQGWPGPALGSVPAARWLLMGAVVLGIVFMAGGLAQYGRSPMMLAQRSVPEPYGLQRVSRHAFFVGVALLGLAHALLAPHLAGALLMGGLGIFALVGARLQDRKLAAERGAPYRDYLGVTSTLPFAAILAGRQRMAWRELPWLGMAIGLVLSLVLRWQHEGIFGEGGLYVAGATVSLALALTLRGWLRERHKAPAVGEAH